MAKREMTYHPLGRCGTKVSAFGLGGWATYGESVKDAKAVRRIVRAAVEAGVNFFDIADIYARGEAERLMGAALRDHPRHTLVISSKAFWPMSDDVNDRGLSRKHLHESIDKTLKRIGTDYLDLYFCHRYDEETPLEETAGAMDDLVRRGKILHWGTSEWSGDQIRVTHRICGERNLHRPQVEQPQFSLAVRQRFETDVRPAAVEHGMGLVVWSPLASGLLTGKYDRGFPKGTRLARVDWLREAVATPENLERARKLKGIADRLGCSRARLALAWAAAQPGVSSVILGATKVEQLAENLGALDVEIPPDAAREIDALFPA